MNIVFSISITHHMTYITPAQYNWLTYIYLTYTCAKFCFRKLSETSKRKIVTYQQKPLVLAVQALLAAVIVPCRICSTCGLWQYTNAEHYKQSECSRWMPQLIHVMKPQHSREKCVKLPHQRNLLHALHLTWNPKCCVLSATDMHSENMPSYTGKTSSWQKRHLQLPNSCFIQTTRSEQRTISKFALSISKPHRPTGWSITFIALSLTQSYVRHKFWIPWLLHMTMNEILSNK